MPRRIPVVVVVVMVLSEIEILRPHLHSRRFYSCLSFSRASSSPASAGRDSGFGPEVKSLQDLTSV